MSGISYHQRNLLFHPRAIIAVQRAAFSAIPPQSSAQNQQSPQQSIFANDSTFLLVKKLMIYRMMSSNLFINHALRGMTLCYKILGRSATNLLINKTAGTVFTSGETISSLIEDLSQLEKRKVGGVANYVVEGLHEMNEKVIQQVYEDLMTSVKKLTEDKPEGHLAIKLTSMITLGIMTRLSKAQEIYLEDILQLWGPADTITRDDVVKGLNKWKVAYTDEEVDALMKQLRFPDSQKQSLSRVERYANGHLFPLFEENQNPFLDRIAATLI